MKSALRESLDQFFGKEPDARGQAQGERTRLRSGAVDPVAGDRHGVEQSIAGGRANRDVAVTAVVRHVESFVIQG